MRVENRDWNNQDSIVWGCHLNDVQQPTHLLSEQTNSGKSSWETGDRWCLIRDRSEFPLKIEKQERN